MDVEKEIKLIKERNKRVEADKAWERSGSRTILVGAITYISVLILLSVTGTPRPYLAAFVPMLGFVLSIQSIPIVKRWWLKNRNS